VISPFIILAGQSLAFAYFQFMYGISKLSIIPGRAEPSDRSEIVTQVLFGEHYEIFEENEKWLHIRLAFDGYLCWIDRKQHLPLSADEYAELQKFRAPRTADILGIAKDQVKETYYNLPMGSRLPFYNGEQFRVGQSVFTFKGTLAVADPANMVQYASNYLNAPYLWGGRTPFGIDCSGFTQMVFALCGQWLPRDAWQQADIGTPVAWDDRSERDLAFFHNKEGKITHVGIVLAGDQIIHASGKVRIDKLAPEGIIHRDSGNLTHTLNGLRRIVAAGG
jgi:hypothetical protein